MDRGQHWSRENQTLRGKFKREVPPRQGAGPSAKVRTGSEGRKRPGAPGSSSGHRSRSAAAQEDLGHRPDAWKATAASGVKWSELGSAELRGTTPSPSARVHSRGSGESQDTTRAEGARRAGRAHCLRGASRPPLLLPSRTAALPSHARPPDGASRQADSLPLHHLGSPIYFEC